MWYIAFIFFVFCIRTLYAYSKCNQNGSSKFKYYIKYWTYYMLISLIPVLTVPYCLLHPKYIRNSNASARLMKHITKLVGIKWHLRNGEILAEDRAAIIISNHQDSLDILGLFNIWHIIDKLTVIAKKSLLYVFPFGLSAYLHGVVFIDRSNPKKAYKQLQSASETIVKDKIKIVMYPEGSRNYDRTKLQPFKKGAFMLAVQAQVPIIPIVYCPYYFINHEKYIFNSGHMVIQCLDPVPTKGLTNDDVPKLIEQLHEKMSAAYKELSKEIFNSLPEDYKYSS